MGNLLCFSDGWAMQRWVRFDALPHGSCNQLPASKHSMLQLPRYPALPTNCCLTAMVARPAARMPLPRKACSGPSARRRANVSLGNR